MEKKFEKIKMGEQIEKEKETEEKEKWEPEELDNVLERIVEKRGKIIWHHASELHADFDSIFKHGLLSQDYAKKKGIKFRAEYPEFGPTAHVSVFYEPELSEKKVSSKERVEKLLGKYGGGIESKWGHTMIICGVDESELLPAGNYSISFGVDRLIKDKIPPEKIHALALRIFKQEMDRFRRKPKMERPFYDERCELLLTASKYKIPVYGVGGIKLNTEEILKLIKRLKK